MIQMEIVTSTEGHISKHEEKVNKRVDQLETTGKEVIGLQNQWHFPGGKNAYFFTSIIYDTPKKK